MSIPDHPDLIKMQEYRAKALDALERAARATDPEAKASWNHVAESYRDMAERLDRRLQQRRN